MENLSIILSFISVSVLVVVLIWGINILISDGLKSYDKNANVRNQAKENKKLEAARLEEERDDSIPSFDEMMW